MTIIYVSNNQRALSIDLESVKVCALNIISFLKQKADEFSVCFVSENTIKQLHLELFNDGTVTDCITVPMDNQDEEYICFGEVFVCPKVAINYVKSNNESPSQELYLKETTLYLIHGILHLCGFDDLDPISKRKMRRKELSVMNFLTKKNCLIKSLKPSN